MLFAFLLTTEFPFYACWKTGSASSEQIGLFDFIYYAFRGCFQRFAYGLPG